MSVVEEGKSGKRVVNMLLALVSGVAALGYFAARRVEKPDLPPQASGESAAVLSEGILYEARGGDPALVIAKDVGSGKELWRAEVGNLKTDPQIDVGDEVIEVKIAGTPWMTLDRETGEALE